MPTSLSYTDTKNGYYIFQYYLSLMLRVVNRHNNSIQFTTNSEVLYWLKGHVRCQFRKDESWVRIQSAALFVFHLPDCPCYSWFSLDRHHLCRKIALNHQWPHCFISVLKHTGHVYIHTTSFSSSCGPKATDLSSSSSPSSLPSSRSAVDPASEFSNTAICVSEVIHTNMQQMKQLHTMHTDRAIKTS